MIGAMSTDHKLTAGDHTLPHLRAARDLAVTLLQTIEDAVDNWDARGEDERDHTLMQIEHALVDLQDFIDDATQDDGEDNPDGSGTAPEDPDDPAPSAPEWDGTKPVSGRHFSQDEVRRASRSWPPPPEVHENLVAVLAVADEVRERCGFPLLIRSAWRPSDGDSQHRFGAALDLDTVDATPENIDRLRMVGTAMWHEKKINGLGIYRRPKGRIHIDIRVPGGKGHRFWHVDESAPYRKRYRDGERP